MKNASNELLRHMVATIAYRFEKQLQNTACNFGDFKAGESMATPCEMINNMCELVRKTHRYIIDNNFNYEEPACVDIAQAREKFDFALIELDKILTKHELDEVSSKLLMQGPLLDVVTSVGQLTMLNNLHGTYVPKEDFSSANIPHLVM